MSVNFGPHRTDFPFNEVVFDVIVEDDLITPSQDAIAPVAGSPYQEYATRFGNFRDDANPFGQLGKGAPAFAFAPVIIDETFGRSSPGANVTKTTQAVFIYGRWYGPTSDDSAEAGSAIATLVDTGTPFAQAQPVVGWEGIAIAQGGNTVSNKLVGVIGSVEAQNTSQVTSAMAFYVSALSGAKAAGAAITNFYGFYQETPDVTGPITNKWGTYLHDDLQIDSQGNSGRLIVGVSGPSANAARAIIVGPNVTGGATEVPTLIVQQGPGQTSGTVVLRTSGASVRLQLFGSTGNILMGNGPGGRGGAGVLAMVTATNPAGAGTGGLMFIDTADGILKFLDAAGVVHALY